MPVGVSHKEDIHFLSVHLEGITFAKDDPRWLMVEIAKFGPCEQCEQCRRCVCGPMRGASAEGKVAGARN